MFPRRMQRIWIAASLVLGTVLFLLIKPWLMNADGGSGISLMSARLPWGAAMALLAAVALPVLAACLLVSTTGNVLSGFFVLGVSLAVLAGAGGPIDGWMHRTFDHAGASALAGGFWSGYPGLLLETVFLTALVVGLGLAIQTLRRPLRERLPGLAVSLHLGPPHPVSLTHLHTLAGMVISTLVSGGMAWVLLRTGSTGQVLGSLILAFTLGSFMAQMLAPAGNALGFLISPALVAVVGYAWAMQTPASAMQHAWIHDQLPGLALALPLYYFSAGLLGASLGAGWAQAFSAKADEAQVSLPAEASTGG